jgi:hypothetical protein
MPERPTGALRRDCRRRVSRMSAATGTNTSRLLGTIPKESPAPSHRNTSGTPAPVCTIISCQTLANPSTTRLIPSVMINGWTRNTPTPIPVASPARAAAASATPIATGRPYPVARVATTKPDIDATAPTERSIPPVSIVIVWHPARIARMTAARRMTPAHSALTMPGRTSWITMTSTPSRPMSGMIGRSRNRARQAAQVSQGVRARSVRAVPLMPRSAAAGRGCRPSPRR